MPILIQANTSHIKSSEGVKNILNNGPKTVIFTDADYFRIWLEKKKKNHTHRTHTTKISSVSEERHSRTLRQQSAFVNTRKQAT